MGITSRPHLEAYPIMSFMSPKPAKSANTIAGTPEEVANSQLGIPVPIVAGTVKIAAKWLTPALNQFTKPSPVERPGKK